MENTNLVLSEEERRIVNDPSVILTKNRIIQIVYDMFGQIANRDRSHWDVLSPAINRLEPKIARGENLSGMPWVMLDDPRLFSDKEIFAIRILFWWGHYFSITLHVSGHYKEQFSASIIHSLSTFGREQWSLDIGHDPWCHDHDLHVFEPLLHMDEHKVAAIINRKDHLRLSKKYSLDQWDLVQDNLIRDRNMLFEILAREI